MGSVFPEEMAKFGVNVSSLTFSYVKMFLPEHHLGQLNAIML